MRRFEAGELEWSSKEILVSMLAELVRQAS